MKYRFKMEKGEEIKFIGHLDLLVAFQRVLKRADIPIDYSKGFNPHQLVSFASPLGLGLTSKAEYGDFQLKEDLDAEEVRERINKNMPDGLYISKLVKLKEGVKNTMTSLERADYEIYFPDYITPDDIKENLDAFLSQKEIVVMKKTKKSTKEADIREDIFSAEDISHDGKAAIKIYVSSGSTRNLKCDTFAEAFCKFINKPFEKYKFNYCRTQMYMKDQKGEYVSLISGVEL